MKKILVLASTSTYRANLLERLGLPFKVATPECDEIPNENEQPAALSQRLAANKAQSLVEAYPNHLIIGSDQVASCCGQILSKPGSSTNAIRQLQLQSGQPVDFYTSIVVLDSSNGSMGTATDHTRVYFRNLDDEEIRRYVDREQPLDCAGSFMCERLGVALFSKIKTEDPTALEGLPLIQLCRLLRNKGINLL